MRLLPLSLLLAGWLLAGRARGQAAGRQPESIGAELAAAPARPLARPAPTASYWLDRDNTPWLRELRRLPNTRNVAYWQAALLTHPRLDTTRAVLLARLADALEIPDARAAYPTRLAALRLAYQLPYRQIRGEALLSLADYHTQLAQYDSAARYLAAAEQQFYFDRSPGGAIRCLARLARIANQQGRYAASLAYSYQALALPLIGNTRRFNTSVKIELATTYAQVGNYAEARRYLREALRIATRQDYPDRLNLALGELGEVYRQQGQFAEARRYFERSIAVSRRVPNYPYVLAMQLNLARINETQGQLSAATALGRQVLTQAQASHLPLVEAPAQALLARLALRQGQLAAAVVYGRQSLAGSQRAHLLAGTAEASAVLADAYARQHVYAPALAALRQYTVAHDSLLGDAARRRAAVLQVGQQQREQTQQIRLLTQRNRLLGQDQELARLRTQRTLIGLSALTLLALLLAGGAFWQYRRRQAAREEALRQRLAADLHDEVGNLLTQVSMQADLLRETSASASAAQLPTRLQRLSDTSRRASRQMADVVWGLHASALTLPELLPRLRDHAYEVLLPTGLAVDFHVSAGATALRPGPEVCQQLYLIYKEALHNAVKHARGATLLTVRLTREGPCLCLHVLDNGTPPPSPAAPAGRPAGHGLRNMRQRAEAVGGTLRLERGPAGFGVWVSLPVRGQ